MRTSYFSSLSFSILILLAVFFVIPLATQALPQTYETTEQGSSSASAVEVCAIEDEYSSVTVLDISGNLSSIPVSKASALAAPGCKNISFPGNPATVNCKEKGFDREACENAADQAAIASCKTTACPSTSGGVCKNCKGKPLKSCKRKPSSDYNGCLGGYFNPDGSDICKGGTDAEPDTCTKQHSKQCGFSCQ